MRKSREILDVPLCKVSQQHNGRNNATIQESWKYLCTFILFLCYNSDLTEQPEAIGHNRGKNESKTLKNKKSCLMLLDVEIYFL